MQLYKINGSHHIYKKKDDPKYTISIQKMNDGKAKPYQVRQLIDFVEEHCIIGGKHE